MTFTMPERDLAPDERVLTALKSDLSNDEINSLVSLCVQPFESIKFEVDT